MPASRHLPAKVNPLMTEEIPPYETLVARRRLGQTDLAVKTGQLNTSSSTRAKNLGTFDYAHLRAPLPKGIHSGIFKPSPASYFLMRRSNDGYISATGMFKATFPYSETAEEETERRYIKSLPTTSEDETAGNVWIPPHHALELAEEYQILPWIKALLDNAPIEVNPTKDQTPKSIAPPPRFDFKDFEPIPAPKLQLDEAPQISPPESLPAPTSARVGRPRRSASPSKYATSSPRKIARPRKASARLASLEPAAAVTTNGLEQVRENGDVETGKKVDSTESTESEPVKDPVKEPVEEPITEESSEEVSEPAVTVKVDTDVEVNGDVETTHTHVQVEMPVGLSELPLPEDTEAMIAKAKEMVEAAVKHDAAIPSRPKQVKRKAEEFEADDSDDEEEEAMEAPAKKVKVAADLKKERVKTRALIGLSATLAIG
ncbi:hypothetical protein DSL72_005792 [Monilinia vaccinii-corymbosi]|uniref:HTH APSES-type domain-containing protein n=1 Tax=Monilinia vaccinii-corymbosi TaxID=61207 RepID=A0A8A3PGN2_9HELO|nr:hypothetical protein DSL72_005792 [Monilinia vaccinii-corymbosi]